MADQNLTFNRGLTGHEGEFTVIDPHHNCKYKLLRPIGHWNAPTTNAAATTTTHVATVSTSESTGIIEVNPSEAEATAANTTVYEAQEIIDGEEGPYFAIKICHEDLEPALYSRAVNEGKLNGDLSDPNILQAVSTFRDQLHPKLFCTVLFNSNVVSLRTLAHSAKMQYLGMPQYCILYALEKVLLGLSHIQSKVEVRNQITAGNVFYFHSDSRIKIAIGSSWYEQTHCHALDGVELESEYLPQKDMFQWAKPPEANLTDKSDIWWIGITALELAYGGILIRDPNALNLIVNFLNLTPKLPNTWEELVKLAKGGTQNQQPQPANTNKTCIGIIKCAVCKKEKRFSKEFAQMIARCLSIEPDQRPTTKMLLNSKIFGCAKSLADFKYKMAIDNPKFPKQRAVALAFNIDYDQWFEEYQLLINGLRTVLSNASDETTVSNHVTEIVRHYDKIIKVKGTAARADVFHILSGSWSLPSEQTFVFFGGFRPSIIFEMLNNLPNSLTPEQLEGIRAVKDTTGRAEMALSQNMTALEQSVVQILSRPIGPAGKANVGDYMISTIRHILHQADTLRHNTLDVILKLTPCAAAELLLVTSIYTSGLRSLNSFR